jgi:hypothetical protein
MEFHLCCMAVLGASHRIAERLRSVKQTEQNTFYQVQQIRTDIEEMSQSQQYSQILQCLSHLAHRSC